MLDGLTFWWKLRRLHRLHASLEAKNDEEIKRAVEQKRFSDLHQIGDGGRHEIWTLDTEIKELKTDRMYEVTRRLSVPLPDRNDGEFWEETYQTKRQVLTDKGYSVLRTAIRQERRERTDWIRTWLPTITAVVSALAAWAAVLWKHG